MRFLPFTLFVLLVFFVPSPVVALALKVEIEGVDGELRHNVLSDLAIYRHRNNPLLRPADVRRLHRRAEKDIAAALMPLGYFSPQIVANLHRDGDGIVASYRITPGEPIRLQSLSIETADNPSWFREEAAAFPLKIGDILHQGHYEDGKKRLLRAANRQGFLDAAFSIHELVVNRKERSAVIRLRLDPGRLYYFGQTDFAPTVIRPSLLAGYPAYRPGDPYQPGKLTELQRTLYATGYFIKARVDAKPDRSDATVPVFVSADLRQAWNHYSFGAGYATDTGMRGRFDWFNRLWNDRGHTVHGSAQLAENEKSLGLDYKIPVGNPDNNQYTVSTVYTDQTWNNTDTQMENLAVGRDHGGKSLLRYGESLELRHERYSVGVTDGEKILLMPGVTATWVDADNLLQPSQGAQVTVSANGAWDGLVSDSSFLKLSGGAKVIVSPWPTIRLIGRAAGGVIAAASIDDLPPSLRFYAGGDNSVRGYGYRGLGPKDASGAVVGGRYLLEGGAEMEKLIGRYWGIAAFWDIGNAMDDFSMQLKEGVGLGLRLRLPFGQVRLDVASAIEEDGCPLRLHLSVGSDL